MTVLVLLLLFFILVAAYLGLWRLRLTLRVIRAEQQSAHAAGGSRPPAPTPFRTLLLVTPADDALTDTAKSMLIDTWGDLPVAELATKTVVDLAFEFQATFPSPKYDDQTRMRIAEKVHRILTSATTPIPPPTKPSSSAQRVSNVRRDLEAMAIPSKHVDGINTKVIGGVYNTLTITGIGNVVQDIIVLRKGRIDGIQHSGRIYTAPGVAISIGGIDTNIKVVQLTWTELAKRAEQQRRYRS